MKIFKTIILFTSFIGVSAAFVNASSLNTESPAIKIDLNNKKPRILFIGGDMERSQSFLQMAANPLQVAQWCFGDVHFDICRVSYDKKQELKEGIKNPSFYDNAIKSMKLLRKVNPKIKFWATMKSDYHGYNNENNLPDWICNYNPTTRFDCDKYAVFLADYLELMQKNGVEISYMAVAKEWTQVITAERAKKIILKLNEICKNRSINIPLYVDPASWGVTQGVNFIEQVEKVGSKDLYYAFSTHNLNKKEHDRFLYETFVNAAARCGKLAFADESGSGPGGRTNGEEPTDLKHLLGTYREKAEFYKDGISGELIFEPFSRGYNAETRSIYFRKGGEAKRMRSYYVMKHFVNSISRKGMSYIEPVNIGLADSVFTMSFSNDKEIFLAVVNQSEVDYNNIPVHINGSSNSLNADGLAFNISLPIEGAKADVFMAGSVLNVNIPSKSIVFFNIKR